MDNEVHFKGYDDFVNGLCDLMMLKELSDVLSDHFVKLIHSGRMSLTSEIKKQHHAKVGKIQMKYLKYFLSMRKIRPQETSEQRESSAE